MIELLTVVVVDDGDLAARLQSAAETDAVLYLPAPTQGDALNTCCALEPACLIVAHRPPALDAAWLTSSVRAQPSSVAGVPIVVLSEDEVSLADHAPELAADVILPRSTEPRALVRQVNALISLVARVRARPASTSPVRRVDCAVRAIHGSLERTNVGTVLALLELQHASGELWLARGPRDQRGLIVELASGAVTGGRANGKRLTPAQAVDTAVHWGPGLFDFVEGPARVPPSNAVTMTALLAATLGTATDDADVERVPTARYMPGERPPPGAWAGPSSRSGLRVKITPPMPRPPATRSSKPPLPREEPDDLEVGTPVIARRR